LVNNDEGEFLRSEKLAYVAAHLSEWTSDVNNNYEDLDELYKELLSV
jgi:hypothetical protein